MPHALFDFIPIWAIFILTVLLSFFFFTLGLKLVNYRKKEGQPIPETPVSAIFAAILSLLAFILAFTFSSAALRYDERNKLVLQEAIAIKQAYFRASFLPSQDRSSVRSLLKEYTLIRLEGIYPQKQKEVLKRSLEIQNELWDYAKEIGFKIPSTNANQLFIISLGDILDAHARRVIIGVYRHIPSTIWYALYFVTILAVTSMGYFVGIKKNHDLVMSVALIISFSAVITLIADLDRSQEGSIRVSQQPLIDFYNENNL